jgi:hypothetical protein
MKEESVVALYFAAADFFLCCIFIFHVVKKTGIKRGQGAYTINKGGISRV